jgi:predicted amidohydrolase
MTRIVTVGAAQLGPIALSDTRTQVVTRMIELMRQAKGCGCDVVVFPELALTTFFPRWYFESQDELDTFFERAMPGPDTQRLFDTAKSLQIGFYLGYAELAQEGGQLRRFNTAIRSTKAEKSFQNTERSIYPVTKNTSLGVAFNTSKSVISKLVTWASLRFKPTGAKTSREYLAWRYAMIDAGLRHTAY